MNIIQDYLASGEATPTTGRAGRITTMGALLVLLALLLAASPPAAADKYVTRYDEPDLIATLEGTNVLEPGETTTLEIAIQNRGSYHGESYGDPTLGSAAAGESPGAAVSTTAEPREGDTPLEVKSGKQSVGTLNRETSRSIQTKIEVDSDAEPGVYRLPIKLRYDYVYYLKVQTQGDGNSITSIHSTETETEYIEVRVDENFDPEVTTTDGDLRVGEDGAVSIRLRNNGHETAHDAEVRLVSDGIIKANDGSSYVGRIPPGEQVQTEYRVSVSDRAVPGDYPIKFRVNYDDSNGISRTSEIETGHVTVGEEPAFEVHAEPRALYVDSHGGVKVDVTNTGETVRNTRVVLHGNPPFVPLSSSSSLGDLRAGETGSAEFRVEVSDRAVPQNYPLDLHVEYLDAFNETTRSDTVTTHVPVGPERTFTVNGTPNVSAGATEEVTFTFRNTGEGNMRDAVARMNADSPFSTDDDTTYLGTLKPGEHANATFRVSVEGGATHKTYSLDALVKYENPYGEKVVTDIEKAPVRVTGGGSLLGFVAELLGL